MKSFIDRLNQTKRISVWGIGYLGYTTILRLQTNGFNVICSTFDKDVKKELLAGNYPYDYMRQQWSRQGDLPTLDLEKVTFSDKFSSMFVTNVHIIAIPAYNNTGEPESYLKLLRIFIENQNSLNNCLVIFQSAERVGTVDEFFIKPLQKVNINCYFASAFRSDWTMEEFFSSNDVRLIAANDKKSLSVVSTFFSMMNIRFNPIIGIRKAELYEIAKNCLTYTIEAYFTQLSFAYPDMDINEIFNLIKNNYEYPKNQYGLNLLHHKKLLQIDHILSSSYGDFLTLIKDTRSINMVNVMLYADILKKFGIQSVTIMGLSVETAIKDIRASSSIIFVEYLRDQNIKIFVHDPYYSISEIKRILPDVEVSLFHHDHHTESYVIMNNNVVYKSLSQKDIESMGLSKARIIIDSTGHFQYYNYSANTIYHMFGDGNLKFLL